MSEITPAVLSADGMVRLTAEIEGLAAKLDVAEALALGRARLLDLLATVIHRDEEIAALRAQLAAVEQERAEWKAWTMNAEDDSREWQTKLAAAEQRVAALTEALGRLADLFHDLSENKRIAEMDEWSNTARRWRAEGDMYGWNFYEGMRAGGNATDILYQRLWNALQETRVALRAPGHSRLRGAIKRMTLARVQAHHSSARRREGRREHGSAKDSRLPRELSLRCTDTLFATSVWPVIEDGDLCVRIDNAGPFAKREALRLARWICDAFEEPEHGR